MVRMRASWACYFASVSAFNEVHSLHSETGWVCICKFCAGRWLRCDHRRPCSRDGSNKTWTEKIFTIRLDHLNENQCLALVISENAGWEEELLRLELQNLADEAAAIDENIPEVQDKPVSRTGDIWRLGEYCKYPICNTAIS
jgi:hypothetical protein